MSLQIDLIFCMLTVMEQLGKANIVLYVFDF